ncbi:hypothetical protein B7494_g6455 [Chlorociboria aeruginascens]|nr:hypothetical protein B7494_g6455 [Chlorociboria aeruginascens]
MLRRWRGSVPLLRKACDYLSWAVATSVPSSAASLCDVSWWVFSAEFLLYRDYLFLPSVAPISIPSPCTASRLRSGPGSALKANTAVYYLTFVNTYNTSRFSPTYPVPPPGSDLTAPPRCPAQTFKVALTVTKSHRQLSLQEHLEIAPNILHCSEEELEGMAQAVPNPPNESKKRVKVYELRENDWFDRGTGFCKAAFIFIDDVQREEPRLFVESEDEPDRVLMETKITKEDMFQKQQDTLIVWTEPSTLLDMALSFQESDGCGAICVLNGRKFISTIQSHLLTVAGPGPGDDALSDDVAVEQVQNSISLPDPGLGNLSDIETTMRNLSNSPEGREELTRFVLADNYIRKLIPLVEVAEDMEDLTSLHRLCNIMKTLILLNDNTIVESVVTDDLILGVVGALEYDPDFPSHKANHRLWLSREGRYKEVVPIDEDIRRKIHRTYRLQYLKDVVLARILDDPTFSVLNSLIFFYQVEIVSHLQQNPSFLKELFGIFGPQESDQERKKEAVLFIQQCCAVAKSLQPPARQTLYNKFLGHGLLSVINFALRHSDVGVRVGATDVLVSMIDHDPQMIRQTIFRQINEKQTPLTDSLIDLLLVEADLGVKAQIADAIKVLLDPGTPPVPLETLTKTNGENPQNPQNQLRTRPIADPQHELFLKNFYDDSAVRLFKPLVDLQGRENMDFNSHQVSLFIYLIEILCFFIRQHTHRSKHFVLSTRLAQRISQLLSSSEKYLKLTALKFFRNLIGLQDEFYNQTMMQDHLFEPILNIVIETNGRDNLLNSACLEFFEFIKIKDIRPLISHLAENYRDKFNNITYVDIFAHFNLKFDQSIPSSLETTFLHTDADNETPKRSQMGRGTRWESGIKDLDAVEEEYFNTSDNEDDIPAHSPSQSSINGASPLSKPLVDYPSDEENENVDPNDSADISHTPVSSTSKDTDEEAVMTPTSSTPGPPERLSEKRRREEDEDDELGKLSHSKRRNSTSVSTNNGVLRRKRSFANSKDGGPGQKTNKIAISLSPAIKTGGGNSGGGDDSG